MQPFNHAHVSAGQLKAREGLSMMRPVELPAGQVLYRFYDSNSARTPEDGANGPWWLEYEHFQSVKHFALRHGYPLGYAARLFAAILYEWSEVNALVRCELLKPLQVWKGRGKQVQSTGRDHRDLPTMTPMQSILEIYQLCIPGIGGPNSIAPQALRVLSFDAVAH
jgi:hypothetical protein